MKNDNNSDSDLGRRLREGDPKAASALGAKGGRASHKGSSQGTSDDNR